MLHLKQLLELLYHGFFFPTAKVLQKCDFYGYKSLENTNNSKVRLCICINLFILYMVYSLTLGTTSRIAMAFLMTTSLVAENATV